MRLNFGCGLALSVWLVGAQDLSRPSLGVVYDSPSHSLRRITGVAGAAYLGQPFVTDLSFACVAPGSRSALLVRDGQLSIMALPSGSTEIVVDAAPGVTGCVWASDGSAVAVQGETSGWFRLDKSTAWNALPPDRLIAAIGSGGKSRVYSAENVTYVEHDGGAGMVLGEAVSAAHFGPDGRLYLSGKSGDLLVYHEGSITRLASLGRATALHTVHTNRLGALTERGLAVVNTKQYDEPVLTDAPAATLERLSGSIFLLRGRASDSEPLWIYDAAQGIALFVPGRDQ